MKLKATFHTVDNKVFVFVMNIQFISLIIEICVLVCSPGVWKVVAKFHSNPQQSYSAQFEVKEYGKSLTL